MESNRKIVHIDMDAFFASVEQLDNPELRGKPVIVGGRPDSRGVVAACSYEARYYGIHSAMPCSRAYALCSHAIFIRPRMERYRELSARIMKIFKQYTDIIEPLSLDEAFLDITENKKRQCSATLLAREICKKIYDETGLTASAGVSSNKFIAKIASDLHKPNGITVIEPKEIPKFINDLPIEKFFGVGKVTAARMIRLGIKNGADLKAQTLEYLVHNFGKHGFFYYDIARGRDTRPVCPSRTRKSIGAERTLREDITNIDEVVDILHDISARVANSLESKKLSCRTVTLKVRYSDFSTITRSHTFKDPVSNQLDLFAPVPRLLDSTEAGYRKVRLLGLSASNLVPVDQRRPRQLPLPFHSSMRPQTFSYRNK